MLPTSTFTLGDIQGFDEDVRRIHGMLMQVAQEISRTNLLGIKISRAENGDPTTALDYAINDLIRRGLPQAGEGWLSEESGDDRQRLQSRRVWVVDPIDGTREFVERIPEWSVSIGLVEDHEAIAGGVLNPCTGELFLGSLRSGFQLFQIQGRSSSVFRNRIASLIVSRREYNEGKWRDFQSSGFDVAAMGSVAYRLALVASGRAQATCTYATRSEWDVAAGVALVHASGGRVHTCTGKHLQFNCELPQIDSLLAYRDGFSLQLVRTLTQRAR